jgi:hypothetical protein
MGFRNRLRDVAYLTTRRRRPVGRLTVLCRHCHPRTSRTQARSERRCAVVDSTNGTASDYDAAVDERDPRRGAGARTDRAKLAAMTLLSSEARALLDLLDPGGRAANLGRLKAKLGLDDDSFERAQTELVDAGLVETVGRGRLSRSAAGDLSIDAQMLLSKLPDDGSTAGNYSLRSQLELDDETYARAKRELRDRGLIKVGVGYGGTVARTAATSRAPTPEPPRAGRHLVTRESELYEPFADWLRSSLEDQELAFSHVKITGTPRGYRRGGGKWSRPDVTAVQVFRYEWLPEVSVEVSSYELKRVPDAEKLESVYEAAAHGRWAHRASLVVEQEEDELPPPAILDEVRRFRLGLYSMRRREDGKFDVKEHIKPPLTTDSQPEDLNDLLSYFLGESRTLREQFRRAIG